MIHPSTVGDRVRFVGWGGSVREYHVRMTGTVVRFTRSGHPVIRLDDHHDYDVEGVEITDRHGCASVTTPHLCSGPA